MRYELPNAIGPCRDLAVNRLAARSSTFQSRQVRLSVAAIPFATFSAIAFQKFKRTGMPSKDEPAVTIQRRGAISLNTAAFEALGSPNSVNLFYDCDERLVGLSAAGVVDADAYDVRGIGQNEATHVVSGKAFLTYYEIPRDVARRWTAEKRDDMLVIDLKQPGTEVSGHSSRAHQGGG